MAENSGIEWTTHTFNPWIGCTKVSAACDHCYAEAWDHRFGGERWGPHAPRTRTKTWGNPIKWNRQAEGGDERPRVFCASLADVFDNHRSILPAWRRELWAMIRQTPNLDWLLLTKRPQNIARFLPDDWGDGYRNVWLGATVENQAAADRIDALTKVPARVRFLSMEPLVGPVDLSAHINDLHWIITGGENGAHYRPVDPDWFRSLRDQCVAADVPFLFKQWEGRNQKEIKAKGRELDGVVHDGYPPPNPTQAAERCDERRKRMTDLPVKPLPEDAVDIAARAVAAEVSAHIREMYPAAAAAVSMKSMTRSLSGVIRNNMARLGRAAERGEIEAEADKMRSERMRVSALRRKRNQAPY